MNGRTWTSVLVLKDFQYEGETKQIICDILKQEINIYLLCELMLSSEATMLCFFSRCVYGKMSEFHEAKKLSFEDENGLRKAKEANFYLVIISLSEATVTMLTSILPSLGKVWLIVLQKVFSHIALLSKTFPTKLACVRSNACMHSQMVE